MSTFVDIMNELREKEKKIVLMDGFEPATAHSNARVLPLCYASYLSA